MVVCAGVPVACRTEPMAPHLYTRGHPYQRYDYETVKRRVKCLKRGASRIEVLIELGSPAEKHGDMWVYLSGRPAFIVPAELLKVHFKNNRYVSYAFKPIVLGRSRHKRCGRHGNRADNGQNRPYSNASA
jgi:hypothetical protein